VLTTDNHNSVNGITAFAKRAGTEITRIPLTTPDLRLNCTAVSEALQTQGGKSAGLFALPAQSNFSGVRHPLDIVNEAQNKGWKVLLDAAAFAPTNKLDLSRIKPDFVSISFYKIFGYPTGIGCLIAKHSAIADWKTKWPAGGTVRLASVVADDYRQAPGVAAFEEGTVDFLMIPAVQIGLEYINQIGIETINTRVRCLTDWTLKQMTSMKHHSGRPLVNIMGPTTTADRGGTIAFSLADSSGKILDFQRVNELAARQGLALRTGCFCNPGAGEAAFGITAAMLKPLFQQDQDISFASIRLALQKAYGLDIGALRASYGIASNFSDAWRLCQFLKRFLNKNKADIEASIGQPGMNMDLDFGA